MSPFPFGPELLLPPEELGAPLRDPGRGLLSRSSKCSSSILLVLAITAAPGALPRNTSQPKPAGSPGSRRAPAQGRLTASSLRAPGHPALASRPLLAGGAAEAPAGPRPPKSGRSAELPSSLSGAPRSVPPARRGAPRPPRRLLHPATPHNSLPGARRPPPSWAARSSPWTRGRAQSSGARRGSRPPAAPGRSEGKEGREGEGPRAWERRRWGVGPAPAPARSRARPEARNAAPPPRSPPGPARGAARAGWGREHGAGQSLPESGPSGK